MSANTFCCQSFSFFFAFLFSLRPFLSPENLGGQVVMRHAAAVRQRRASLLLAHPDFQEIKMV
jgi:hypothetical protein